MKLFIMHSAPLADVELSDKFTETTWITEGLNKYSESMVWQSSTDDVQKVDVGLAVVHQLRMENRKQLQNIINNEPDVARIDFPSPFAASIINGVKRVDCPHRARHVTDYRCTDIAENKALCRFCHTVMTSDDKNEGGLPDVPFHGDDGTAKFLVIDRELTEAFKEREDRLNKYFVVQEDWWPAGRNKFVCLYLKEGESVMIAIRDSSEWFLYDKDDNVLLPHTRNAHVGILTYKDGDVTVTDVEEK